MDLWWVLLIVAVVLVVAGAAMSARVVKQYERGLVFRFGGCVGGPRGPGLTVIVPVVDRLQKVNMQIVTMPVPAQDGITRDNVTVKVDAVVYFRVIDPVLAVVNVQNYPLRRVAGRADLAAVGDRQERAGRPAVQPRTAEPGPGGDDRQPGVGLGHPHRPGGDQGRRAARDDEAVDVPAGRGRTGTPRQGHLRGRRAAGLGETLPGRRHDGRHPRRPAAAAAGDDRLGGRREELHSGAAVPGRAAAVPRARQQTLTPANDHRPATRTWNRSTPSGPNGLSTCTWPSRTAGTFEQLASPDEACAGGGLWVPGSRAGRGLVAQRRAAGAPAAGSPFRPHGPRRVRSRSVPRRPARDNDERQLTETQGESVGHPHASRHRPVGRRRRGTIVRRPRRLDRIHGFGIDKVAAAAEDNPGVLRLENRDTDLAPPPEAVEATRDTAGRDDANGYLPFTGRLDRHVGRRAAAMVCARGRGLGAAARATHCPRWWSVVWGQLCGLRGCEGGGDDGGLFHLVHACRSGGRCGHRAAGDPL